MLTQLLKTCFRTVFCSYIGNCNSYYELKVNDIGSGKIYVLGTLGMASAERLQYLYRNLWKKY